MQREFEPLCQEIPQHHPEFVERSRAGRLRKNDITFGAQRVGPGNLIKLDPVVIEDLDLPNPVIRSHYGHGFASNTFATTGY